MQAQAANAQSLGALEGSGRTRLVFVVDGDTVVLDSGRQVRLVDIQAPRLPLGRPGFVKWSLADEAKAALEALVVGETVKLGFGGRRVDRHDRLLAHLLTADDVWVQEALLSQGFARVYSFADKRSLVADMMARERRTRTAGSGRIPIMASSIRRRAPHISTSSPWSRSESAMSRWCAARPS
mgnify:CR=1 FL=1